MDAKMTKPLEFAQDEIRAVISGQGWQVERGASSTRIDHRIEGDSIWLALATFVFCFNRIKVNDFHNDLFVQFDEGKIFHHDQITPTPDRFVFLSCFSRPALPQST